MKTYHNFINVERVWKLSQALLRCDAFDEQYTVPEVELAALLLCAQISDGVRQMPATTRDIRIVQITLRAAEAMTTIIQSVAAMSDETVREMSGSQQRVS